jgi:hypothetical protein
MCLVVRCFPQQLIAVAQTVLASVDKIGKGLRMFPDVRCFTLYKTTVGIPTGGNHGDIAQVSVPGFGDAQCGVLAGGAVFPGYKSQITRKVPELTYFDYCVLIRIPFQTVLFTSVYSDCESEHIR